MFKKAIKKLKKAEDSRSIYNTLRSSENSQYEARRLHEEDDELRKEAQRLQAKIYIERNFIVKEDLDEDFRMHTKADPHQHHSTYFSVIDKNTGRVVGTSRQIEHHHAKQFSSFPMLEKSHIAEQWRKFIESKLPFTIVEISGLAKQSKSSSIVPLYLYRQMWHHSIEQQHDTWLMACDVRLFHRLKIILGDAIIQIGEETDYVGASVIPAVVKPNEALEALIDSTYKLKRAKRHIRSLIVEFFVDGLPTHYLSESELQKLHTMGIKTEEKVAS